MKKNVVRVIIVTAVAGLVWFIYQQKQKNNHEMAQNKISGISPAGMNVEQTKPVVELKTYQGPQSKFYKAPDKENLPVGWEDFYEVSKMGRLDMVTEETTYE